MDKYKITHIVYSGFGGTIDYVLNLIKGDANKEVEHQIIFYGIEETSKIIIEQANKVAENAVFIPKKPGIDKTALSRLKSILLRANPQTVTLHVNSLIYHLPALLPAKTQLIYVEHQANHLKTKKEWAWSFLAQRRADKIICLTKEYQNQLKKKLRFFFRSSKNELIQTGIQLSEYAEHSTASNSSENTVFKIGMVSRINSMKDHSTLLAAFTEINPSNVELHIAGEGDLLNELFFRYKQQNVFFQGFIPQNKIPAFLGELSIYIQASFGETSSIAIMQAQASGLPIIASDVRGINTVLSSENACLVPVKDVAAMKSALLKLIEDEKLRDQLGKKSLQYSLDFLDNKKMFQSYKKILV